MPPQQSAKRDKWLHVDETKAGIERALVYTNQGREDEWRGSPFLTQEEEEDQDESDAEEGAAASYSDTLWFSWEARRRWRRAIGADTADAGAVAGSFVALSPPTAVLGAALAR
jgi:hypothetical protein